MQTLFFVIVVFLCMLAVFDLVVGVSNDAVNFINSAVGSRVASFRTIIAVASIGVFVGAAMSNGMMDVARHGIFTPQYYSFYDVMCIFLAVMVTDVVLLDVFNSQGMPTSTTVSMVFELLGGAFAIALLKIMNGSTSANGTVLSLGDLLNTEKAMSVILGIFLSVAIAFVLGSVVQWIARIVFTFNYQPNEKDNLGNEQKSWFSVSNLKIGIFGGVAVTCIVWFLLINGLKNSSFMTADVKTFISNNTWHIIAGVMLVFSALLTIASALKLQVLKFIILLGTFALAMAFAGNDLVNFIGVPLTGLESYTDYVANGNGNPHLFQMKSLMESAHTPTLFLVLAGCVMVLSLIFSKKAQNVTKTEIGLGNQNDIDPMFGSSAIARSIVRSTSKIAEGLTTIIPSPIIKWIDSRFNINNMELPEDAAFDQIRAAVNIVLAGLLVAIGTSMKLPLSTTYVTFIVAMGTSLADRAWSRDSAVFRVSGVLNVIGGWFVTAGVAFIACFTITNGLYFGKYVAMICAVAFAIFLVIRSNKRFKKLDKTTNSLFKQIMKTTDKSIIWQLLCDHIRQGNAQRLNFVISTYLNTTDAFVDEKYRTLKHVNSSINNELLAMKNQRRREILIFRRIDPMLAIQRNTWYFLSSNSIQQMLYCLKRINDMCKEHVGNNYEPIPDSFHNLFIARRNAVIDVCWRALNLLSSADFTNAEIIREECNNLQMSLSADRKDLLNSLHSSTNNITTILLTINIIQESQELVGSLRHMIRGMNKFAGDAE